MVRVCNWGFQLGFEHNDRNLSSCCIFFAYSGDSVSAFAVAYAYDPLHGCPDCNDKHGPSPSPNPNPKTNCVQT